jgi:hypothetical protein
VLDLPTHSWVCDRSPVHPDVIITKIQEFFPGELSVVVSDDGVRALETENDVLDEIYYLLGANLSQGPHLDPLSELVNRNEQVGQAPGHFLEGPKEVQAPHGERPCNGDRLEPLGQSIDLPCKVLPSSTGPHDLSRVTGGHRPVKTLPKSLSDHAS